MPQDQKITRDQIKGALLRSGYLLETRVETELRDGYYVEANASYQDPDTGKSRELDVFAISGQQAGPSDHDYVFPILLIECVNNTQPVALLTKDPMVPFLHQEEIKLSGLPVKVRNGGSSRTWQPLMEYLGAEHWHHYCQGRVATQFCSFVKKRGGEREWMATHEGTHFDAFKKLCDAVDYYRDSHFRSWTFDDEEAVSIQIYYPVVVFQGELLEAVPGKRTVRLRRAPHLQMRRSVATHGLERDYQIDVIQERYLPKYLDLVDEEIAKMTRLMRRRRAIIRKAVDDITRQARRLRSPEKIQSAMDFDR